MAKPKQQTKQDAYTSNLLISLLMRFPEIMSINFNTESEQAKFTFVLQGTTEKEEFSHFKSLLKESLDAYEELTGDRFHVKTKLQRSGKLNLLEITSCTDTLSLEGIQLITGIVDSSFPDRLMIDAGTAEAIHDEEMMRQEEIIDYLLTHSTGTKKENLIAFREAGKFFVYDK